MASPRAVCLVAFAASAFGFQFPLKPREYKCFSEEFPPDHEFSADWAAEPGYAQLVDLKITNPFGQVLKEERAKDKGRIQLITTHGGVHTMCFYNRLVAGAPYKADAFRQISFKLNEGGDAKDYEDVAKVEHLRPIEVNLRMMEDTVRSIHADYQFFKDREMEMRDTSESTNSRSMWVTIISMTTFFLFGLWQVRHMKKYFQQKKLI
eukprot:TRINITY_DN7249_c0_g1_i1.p1 TRINITY_DN7249_c0_g1~~TRINITY_DN7249_c0_g1_i1.p1  ORF type:complete len:225 (+),score=97.76 TRINITY_DN7249_c0_g1_i1:55-675(+)